MLWLLCLKMLRFCAENYANQDGSHRTFFEQRYVNLCVCQAFIHTWLCGLTQCVLHHRNLSASCHLRLSIKEILHDGFRHTVWTVSKVPVLGTNELLPELHGLYYMQARSGVVLFFFWNNFQWWESFVLNYNVDFDSCGSPWNVANSGLLQSGGWHLKPLSTAWLIVASR